MTFNGDANILTLRQTYLCQDITFIIADSITSDPDITDAHVL
jgi:hypothetical protein